MKYKLKKAVAALLAVVVCFTSIPITTFANSNADSGGSSGSASPDPGSPTMSVSGIKISFALASDLGADIKPLEGNYGDNEIRQQTEAVEAALKTKYLRPGNLGLNYAYDASTMAPISTSLHVVVTSDGMWGQTNFRTARASVGNIDRWEFAKDESYGRLNQLAWQIYKPEGWQSTRPSATGAEGESSDPRFVFNSELYKMIYNGPSSFSSAEEWSAACRAAYTGDDPGTVVDTVFADYATLASKWQHFIWAASAPINEADSCPPSAHVQWDVIGYISSLLYLVWATEEVDPAAASEMLYKLSTWADSGYTADTMPMVTFERTNGIVATGGLLTTLPVQLYRAYPNVPPEVMYHGWDSSANMNDIIGRLVAGQAPPDDDRKKELYQGTGMIWDTDGTYRVAKGKIGARKFFQNFIAVKGTELYGYIPSWTMFTTFNPIPNPPDDGTNPARGSFTWKLNPNGVIDKTPGKDINEPSVIYDLDIAQDGRNKNNFQEWRSSVYGDSSDCNKIKITIYHISEMLSEDTKSTEYTRAQVKGSGKPIEVALEKVTPGDGVIQNIPILGSLKSGEISKTLTDEEFLTILQTANGLTYTETVAGPLEKDGKPEGVRVTYAIYVDVFAGCKQWEAFTNEQAEYVEYRSEPGTYNFVSNDPKGFAEIKCGYFNGQDGYSEPYEAMAGCPTTNNLYFVSGGQEFVAQIKYQYTADKDAVRTFEQKYSAETCEGYWTPVTKTFTDAKTEDVQKWLNTWTGSAHTEGEFITAKACAQCGTVHQNGTGKEAIQKTDITNENSTDVVTVGPYYSEVSLEATHWDWTGCKKEKDDKGNITCPGGNAAKDATSGTAPHAKATNATRWTGTVKTYHVDYNENTAHEKNQGSIKWEQDYTDMNYAKIKEAHVWRLEKSRVEGIRQLTFEKDDAVLADAEELADVIFNVAEVDNAAEGRMFYALHSMDRDAFVFTETLKTRGCCHCFNHNAAEDLIASKENPNNLYEDAWCISDHLILNGFHAVTSLLYHEYKTQNGTKKDKPILKIRVSGTDSTSRTDNGYYVFEGAEDAQNVITETETMRGYDLRGTSFKSQVVSFNTYANATEGTVEKICENSETYVNKVKSDDLSWAGYNGRGPTPGESEAQRVKVDKGALSSLAKYSGKNGVTNFTENSKAGSTVVDGNTTSTKKIFLAAYKHANQGEVDGFSTSSPHNFKKLKAPFILAKNDIDIHDVKVHNGEKSFSNATIFYHNVISWGGGQLWSEDQDKTYNNNGFTRKTNYSNKHEGINKIIIHNPVSAQFAKLIPLPSDLDQRVDTDLILDSLNQDDGKCPGKANACKYAHINCQYNGTRYHTDDCYVEVRGTGLATLPHTGSTTTEMKPVETIVTKSGSQQFGYTGARQIFVAPETGTYHFNLYGAQGGTTTRGGNGGNGGRAYGDITLSKGQSVFIYVGGAGGTGYNAGGYNGGGGGSNNGGGGGGMSSISTDPNSAAAPSNVRQGGAYLCDGEACMSSGRHRPRNCPYGHSCDGCSTCHTCKNGNIRKPYNGWNNSLGYFLIAGGGGGAGGPGSGGGGIGGGSNGGIGGDWCGTPGGGGAQTGGGYAGTRNATAGTAGSGGSGLTSATSGGGGGGGGWFGGGGGGNDYSRYHDIDDSGGGGGSGYINPTVKNSGWESGVRSGHGLVEVSYTIDVKTIVYVPVISGSYEYDKTQGDIIAAEMKPHIFTATESGYYSVHLYGASGGGAVPGQPSAGGKGGYAGGQIYLKSGQQVLVTVGGVGANGATTTGTIEYEWVLPTGCGNYSRGPQWSPRQPSSGCSNHSYSKTGRSRGTGNISGGYNGGGNGGADAGGSFGGGGATDIAINFTYHTAQKMSTQAGSGILRNGVLDLTTNGAFYWGPRISSTKGHIYRVDYYGQNLDKANYDTLAYTQNWTSNTLNNATLLHSYITSEHAQLFWRVDTPSLPLGQEFRVHGNGAALLKEVYVVDMNDRLMVAGGGGGSDNLGGTLNGVDDGRGGKGGGVSGEDGYTNGVRDYRNAGAKSTSGYAQGIGQDADQGADNGAGGAGWYGGSKGSTGNSGGGGGSTNLGTMQNAITNEGQNTGAGYAVFVKPGKGEVAMLHQLSCSEPHHAPNSNWQRYTEGWKHSTGDLCTGVGCQHCANGFDLYSPTGQTFTQEALNTRSYIIKHDDEYHLTDGSDNWCDTCNRQVTFERYTLDTKTYADCCWRTTSIDAACYSTAGAANPSYHYAFGDDTCYDPCLDDEKHKKIKTEEHDPTSPKRSGQFVVLDYDFQVYFPNKGDFYDNGAFGLNATQSQEGWGYINDMDTTIWLKEKYLKFPYDVTYNGHTYMAGEKVMLGVYDEATYTWTDDRPQDYTYTFHCLLNNNETAAARIEFVARAKNCEFPDVLENTKEARNYKRYDKRKRAKHDAYKEYFIDVIGRIGVLSIEDTGDFRFSNYYKQALEGWQVDQVVHKVDLGKQNFVSVDQKTIFNDKITSDTKGQNTWGLTDWLEPIDKLRAFPLTPGENNVKALKNQAHRIGYSDYMSLVTVGDYYGENTAEQNNVYKAQIQPYYYYYNLDTKEWVPVDVYIKDGDKYKAINKHGSTDSTADYNFNYNLNWESEYKRRMYTKEEEDTTKLVQENYSYVVTEDVNNDVGNVTQKINIPHGIKYLHGTANMLFLRDGNRTFIGTRNRYGENTEKDGRINDVYFNRQAQRWNFTLGLPSTAAFVRKGEPCTPENIAKYDMEKGVIVCALDILARGKVWTLKYDGVPVGERSFYLFDNKTTLISWENAGDNGPQDKQVVVVYTDAKTSRNDLNTEGTH